MLEVLLDILFWVVLLLSVASVVFGLVSWYMLPEWRQFRHYVFINTLLTYPVYWTIFAAAKISWGLEGSAGWAATLIIVHWPMVMSFIECLNAIINLETIERRYLVANIFGWVLPLVSGAFLVQLQIIAKLHVIVLPISVYILYVLVVCVFCKMACGRVTGQGASVCAKFIVATLVFICGMVMPTLLLIAFFYQYENNSDYYRNIFMPIYHIDMLFINILFLSLKSHRALWSEYWHSEERAGLIAASSEAIADDSA